MDAGLTYRRRQSYGCVDASIKPSAPDVSGFFVQPQPGGNIRVTGATLVPGRNSPGNAQQMRERLKSLLAERFQLATSPFSTRPV